MDQQLYTTVESILVGTFDVPPDDVTPDADILALDLDSLDLVELTLIIEEQVGVKVEDDELEHVRTVRDVVELVAAKQTVGA